MAEGVIYMFTLNYMELDSLTATFNVKPHWQLKQERRPNIIVKVLPLTRAITMIKELAGRAEIPGRTLDRHRLAGWKERGWRD